MAGRPIRSFRPGGNSRRCFSSLRPGGLSPFPGNPFHPSRSLVFQPRAFAVFFFVFLYAGVIGGLCRRAALPVRTLPPAGSARHSALLFHPSALRPSAWSLSRPSARMSTPPMVLFFERQLHAILPARAPVSLLNKKQLSPLYVFKCAAINLSHPPPSAPRVSPRHSST